MSGIFSKQQLSGTLILHVYLICKQRRHIPLHFALFKHQPTLKILTLFQGSGLTPIASSGSAENSPDFLQASDKQPGDTTSRASDLFDLLVSPDHEFVKPKPVTSRAKPTDKQTVSMVGTVCLFNES